ncbi:MAG TPA: hypothetical protein VLC46_16530 [Thermoanaerobaculia bacterium]|jgi:hypothetical protein|nr:hypothetical protein [Thermoanaerobaculia bacterium]
MNFNALLQIVILAALVILIFRTNKGIRQMDTTQEKLTELSSTLSTLSIDVTQLLGDLTTAHNNLATAIANAAGNDGVDTAVQAALDSAKSIVAQFPVPAPVAAPADAQSSGQ